MDDAAPAVGRVIQVGVVARGDAAGDVQRAKPVSAARTTRAASVETEASAFAVEEWQEF